MTLDLRRELIELNIRFFTNYVIVLTKEFFVKA